MYQNLEIEIVDTELIEGGIAVFARAWDGAVQIGFGADGSVDIERFRFYNPPILVPDENGVIVRTFTDPEGVEHTDKYREDPEQALLLGLKEVINLVGKDGSNVVAGKIGNTTSTFYPVAGANSPVDGGSARTGQGSWSAARDTASGTSASPTDALYYVAGENEGGGSYGVYRLFTCFDTSSIPDGDTISSATVSLYGGGGVGSQTVGVTQSTLASTANVVTGDFDGITVNSPAEGATRQSYNASAYNNFALNSTGRSWINKTGVTQFCFRDEKDIDNVTPPSSPRQYKGFYMADETGTTKDPKLVVEHAATGVTVTPSAQVATFSVPAYTVKRGATQTPLAQVATFSVPAYTVKLPKTVAVTTQVAIFSIPAYVIAGDGNITVTPSAQVLTASIPAYTIVLGKIVEVSTQVATLSIPASTIVLERNIIIGALTQVLTFSIPALFKSGRVWSRVARQTNSTWSRRSMNSD